MFRFASLLIVIAGLLGSASVRAQTTPLNVMAAPYNAKNDAVWGITGCQFTTTHTTDDSIQCPNGTFANATGGQELIADNGVASASGSSIMIPGAPTLPPGSPVTTTGVGYLGLSSGTSLTSGLTSSDLYTDLASAHSAATATSTPAPSLGSSLEGFVSSSDMGFGHVSHGVEMLTVGHSAF